MVDIAHVEFAGAIVDAFAEEVRLSEDTDPVRTDTSAPCVEDSAYFADQVLCIRAVDPVAVQNNSVRVSSCLHLEEDWEAFVPVEEAYAALAGPVAARVVVVAQSLPAVFASADS